MKKPKLCDKCHNQAYYLNDYRNAASELKSYCQPCTDAMYKLHQESRVIFDIKAMRPKKLFG